MDGRIFFSWLKVWKVKIVAFARRSAAGAAANFVPGFVVLTFPIINDLL